MVSNCKSRSSRVGFQSVELHESRRELVAVQFTNTIDRLVVDPFRFVPNTTQTIQLGARPHASILAAEIVGPKS
jgi:hypothetical protein